jgi:dienelactone hydrolase
VVVNRRTLLVGGCLAGFGFAGLGAVALVDHGILPGQDPLNRALGRCDVATPPADAAAPAGSVVRGAFDSARRHRRVNFTIGYPPGARPGDRLPVCLVLHGYGGDASSSLTLSAPLASAGLPPFALAAMDGGGGYWHPHASDDPLGALLDEFLPLLASHGLAVERVAALGWSMGGYGALLCGLSRPSLFAAVVASSPAIWRSYGEAYGVNAGAFDSAAEWARYDLLARAGELDGLRVRIDCGEHDPFAPAVRALQGKLSDPSVVHLTKGCHDGRFWEHVAPAQLRFVGEALVSAN